MAGEIELNGEQGTASLAGVIGLSLISMGLALAMLSANQGQVQHSRQSRELAIVRYAALAGANDALAEVRLGTDGAGDRAGGLGRLGVGNPIVYNDANGNPVGEYVTYVINRAADPANDPPEYFIRVLAAVPSFAAEQANANGSRGFGMEFRLNSEVTFSLAPNLGAISYSGPVDTWQLNNWSNTGFTVTGNDYPAVVFTDQDAYDGFIDRVEDNWDAGWNVESRITGSPMQTQAEGESTEFEAPFSLQSEAAFSAETLNDYRNALREYAQGLAHVTENSSGSKDTNWGGLDVATGRLPDEVSSGGIVVKTTILHTHPDVKNGAGSNKPRITQDLDFPITPGATTNVVVIDSSQFEGGSDQVTDNHGRTITGAGTIVILHPIGSKTDNANGKQFNLDWDGDVIVVGYPDDTTSGVGNNSRTDNLLYLSRADWDVDGNVILLSSGSTEASLEMRGTGSDTANLTINGSLLMFAEATGREAEIDIEANANMTVNGIVGVYGKRAELENQDGGTGTNWTINGTLAVGLPDNTSTSAELQVEGSANFNFSLDDVNAATENLANLQQNLTFQNEIPNGFVYGAQSWLLENRTLYTTFEADLPARIAAAEDLFVDTALLQQNRQ